MGCACVKQAVGGGRSSVKPKASSGRHSNVAERLDLPPAAPSDTADSKSKKSKTASLDSNLANDSKKKDKKGATHAEEKRASGEGGGPRNIPRQTEGEQVAAGWPAWLSAVAGESIKGWIPRKADTFEKLDKVSCSMMRWFPIGPSLSIYINICEK